MSVGEKIFIILLVALLGYCWYSDHYVAQLKALKEKDNNMACYSWSEPNASGMVSMNPDACEPEDH